MKNIKVILIFLSLFFVLNCSSRKSIFKKYENIEPINTKENSKLEGWQNYYFSTNDCKCIYGGDFFIAIKEPATQSSKLMISLQGGGACWPGMTNCKSKISEDFVKISDFTTKLEIRLNEDWNQVVIPYCDGSVFLGDAEHDYNSDQKIDLWHYGLKNSVAALNHTKKIFPNISKIFLTGCSAGGYGTIIQLRILKELYPEAAIFVLNESGPGLLKPEKEFWNMIDTAWNFSKLIPKKCEECKGQLIYWYEDMLKDPLIKIGLYSSYNDRVIGQKFLKMEPKEYKTLLLESSNKLNLKYPNQFKRFFVKGDSHCVGNRNYQVNGIKYWDWVLGFVNENENWKDNLE